MANVHIENDVYVLASDIEVDDVSDIINIMNNNFIYPSDILNQLLALMICRSGVEFPWFCHFVCLWQLLYSCVRALIGATSHILQ